MSLKGSTVYEDIVKEDDDEVVEVWPENQVHCGLEGRWHVAQPKQHYFELVMAVMGSEGGLGDISIMYPNMMVALQQIELREAFRATQLV